MKRILFISIFLLLILGINAQILTNKQTVPSIPNSNVLLDGSSNFSAESGAQNSVGKGIIIPGVDLVNFEFNLTLADGVTFPTYFDGMIVYNNATGTTRTDGNRSSTATDVVPGLYIFFNPNGATNQNVMGGYWMPIGNNSCCNTIIPTTSITILGNKSVNIGESINLTAVTEPDNATNPTLIWTVTNHAGSATIDPLTGKLTGVSSGVVYVHATAVDGSGVSATYEVMVNPIPIANILIKGSDKVSIGQFITLEAEVSPTNASNKKVSWTVVNGTGSASIDPVTGLLLGVKAGTVTVTATAEDGSGMSASKEITVESDSVPVSTITISGPNTVKSNQSIQLEATVEPNDATNTGVTWSVTNVSGTATIDPASGLLTGGTTGTVIVTAEARDGSGVKSTYVITVTGDPSTMPIGSGSFIGKTCFDIAYGNDNNNSCGPISGRTSQRTDFSVRTYQDPAGVNASMRPYTGVQVYTFTPDGTVSNVRFEYVDASGKVIEAIAPTSDYEVNNISTACKVAVIYKTSLNTDLRGLSSANALKVDIYAIYNDAANGTGTDRSVKLTAKFQDCACCGAYIDGGVWLSFMCHNLGATESLDPFTPNRNLHGAKYRFGAKEASLSMSADQASNSAISTWNNKPIEIGNNVDWTKANNPCPAGWRLPTIAEWEQVIDTDNNTQTKLGTWSTNSYTSGRKYGDALFLPATGYRYEYDGASYYRGTAGYYWSSTTYSASKAYYMHSGNTNSRILSTEREYGYAIRCVAE